MAPRPPRHARPRQQARAKQDRSDRQQQRRCDQEHPADRIVGRAVDKVDAHRRVAACPLATAWAAATVNAASIRLRVG
jgi:hypothetical protein